MASNIARTQESPPVTRVTWRQVMAWRSHRHHLDRRVPDGQALAVATRLCGLHAQVMSSAELSLWARVESFEPDAVRRLLWQDRALVKTWAMRGTLHLLPSADYALWQAALRTFRHYLRPSWFRYIGVPPDEFDQLIAAMTGALDGAIVTREELAERVARATGVPGIAEKLREGWGTMLKPAAFRGVLCFAPDLGRNVRFTRPATWLGPQSAVDPQDAMLDVTRRFLSAYAPASREDFARWWGTSPSGALALFRRLGTEACEVDVEGRRAWVLTADLIAVEAATPSPSVRLLPGFDPYVIGATSHASHLLPGPFAARIYRPQGWVSPVLLVGGRMEGVWRHERKGRRIAIRIDPFVEISAPTRAAVDEEAERLAAFLGAPVDITWSRPEGSGNTAPATPVG